MILDYSLSKQCATVAVFSQLLRKGGQPAKLIGFRRVTGLAQGHERATLAMLFVIEPRLCILHTYLNRCSVALILAALVSACSDRTSGGAPGERLSASDKSSQPTAARPASSPKSFINKVWRVQDASDIPAGALYVFLSDGTLVMASPAGTPALGQWRYENESLVMVEEGIAYRVEVLELTAHTFRIRSHNPGEPVDITFLLATEESGR